MPDKGSPYSFDLGPLQAMLESGYTLLTPNLRLARRIRAEWDQQQLERGHRVWEPATVSAIDHWLQSRWLNVAKQVPQERPRVLSMLQQAELWRQVIAADTEASGTYNLLRVDAAVKLAQQARDNLLLGRVPLTESAVRDEFRFDTDSTTFFRWLTAFNSTLTEQHCLTPVDCWAQLLTASPARVGHIALVDFDDIAPLYRAAVDAAAETVEVIASGRNSAVCAARSFPDRRAELCAIADWAAAEYRRDSSVRLGIIVTDMQSDRAPLEYLLRRAFGCLGDNYTTLPVNFSTGITLDRAPVVRDAIRMLATAGRTIPMADLLGLLQTRFSSLVIEGGDLLVKLLQQLFNDGTEQVSTARVRQLATSVLIGSEKGLPVAKCLLAISTMRFGNKRCLPSAWVVEFVAALESFSWPGAGPLDSLEYQQVESWYAVLETFAGFDAISAQLNFDDALALLRRCCQGQISQPQTNESGIQVLGALEGAGLQFEQVWVCGMQGSRWPAPARPNPFLPMVLQRRYDMPHSSAEREWRYAATLFSQYQSGCRQLTASYARQADGVAELPSPLLSHMQCTVEDAVAPIADTWRAAQQEASRTLQRDQQAPPVDTTAHTAVKGGSAILQAQANCPFRAFASKRLLAEPLEDYREGLSPAERGSLLHDALYSLWGELGDSDTLQGLPEDTLQDVVTGAAQAAIAAAHDAVKQRVGGHCMALEQARLVSLLHEWLEVERMREPFSVVSREQPVVLELADLELNLRVDRVDELADGSRLVIDYKSGRSVLSSWLGERPSQPQLPLYGLTGDIDGVAFAQVRARDCKITGLGQVSGVPGVQDDLAKAVKRYSTQEDWPGLLDEWRANLQQLAAQFTAGHAVVDPLPDACKYCGLQALCRVELPQEESL